MTEQDQIIQPGDTVRHKSNPRFSNLAGMTVIEVDDSRAKCAFSDWEAHGEPTDGWIPLEDLVLVAKNPGGELPNVVA